MKFINAKNEKPAPQLVFTGDVLERNGLRYDVIIADMNLFVIARRKTYRGRETGVTSYMGLEAYSNDPSVNTLEELAFTPSGRWLKDNTPLGKAVAEQMQAAESESDEEEPEA